MAKYLINVHTLQVNPGRQGFYRVSYSPDMFSCLLLALRQDSLSPQDRMGIQNDAFALVSHFRSIPGKRPWVLKHNL